MVCPRFCAKGVIPFFVCPLFVLLESLQLLLSKDLTSSLIRSYTLVFTATRTGWGHTFLSIVTKFLVLPLVIWAGQFSGLFASVPLGLGALVFFYYSLEPFVSPPVLD